MEIEIELVEEGKLPSKNYKEDACYDCYVRKIEQLNNDMVKCYLGFKADIPQHYHIQIYPRSSIFKTDLRLSNNIGIIDSGFTGEISAIFDVVKNGLNHYNIGDRCCQMRLVKNEIYYLKQVNKIYSQLTRGENGYGSSGK